MADGLCRRCGVGVLRTGSRGRVPSYCPDCRKAVDREYAAARYERRPRRPIVCEICAGEFMPTGTYQKHCAACRQEAQRRRQAEYRSRDPERTRDAQRRYVATKDRDYWRTIQRRHYYGLEPEQYEALFDAQGRSCAICRGTESGKRDWCVDHDHACCPGQRKTCGKCVRGILCNACNVGISRFRDDPALLRAAIAYLERQ